MVEIPGNAAPPGTDIRILTARDGVNLRASLCATAGADAGTAFLLNGRTEFLDKYFDAARALRGRGFAVLSLDWRGQGLSDRLLADGERGHVGAFADFALDLDALIDWARDRALPRPWIVVAHSMGGFNALSHAVTRPGRFDGLALSAPMLRVPLPAPALAIRALAKALSRLAPGAYAPGQGPYGGPDTRFEGNRLSSDPARFAVHDASCQAVPALKLGGPTNRWLAEALDAMSGLGASGVLEACATPVLIASALADEIVDPAAHATAAARLPRGRLLEIPGARHEILREADIHQDPFWAAFDDWRAKIG